MDVVFSGHCPLKRVNESYSPEAHVRPGLTVDHHRDGQVLLNGSSADRGLTGVCARVVFPHILNAE